MLTLRGHHLICLHFFRGEGYTQEFIAILGAILKRAETGEQITVMLGADDVCKICPYLKGGKCFYAQDADQEIQEMDSKALKLLELTVRDSVVWTDIREKIPGLFSRWSNECCKSCDWRKACEKDHFFHQLSHEKP
jgi:uncharacterized protein